MKRLSFFIFHFSFFIVCATAQIQMRNVFAAMPDSVLPLVTKNNRLDCIDFIENNMEAKVRNKMDEYVTLEALTADYARFRTSGVSLMEMKLLPTSDTTSVLCVVTTAQVGEKDSQSYLEDSNIRFFDSDWSPLVPDSMRCIDQRAYANVEAYIGEKPEKATYDFRQALQSLSDLHPVKMSLSADEPTLTLTMQTSLLSKEERKAVSSYLKPFTLRWDGRKFVER